MLPGGITNRNTTSGTEQQNKILLLRFRRHLHPVSGVVSS